MNRLARAGALLVAAALAVGLTPAAGLADTTTSATITPVATTRSGVQLALTGVGPVALAAGDDLLITGTVRNATNKRLTGATVSVTVQDRLDERADVQDWVDGTTPDGSARRARTEAKVRKLLPGGADGFSLRIPVDQLGLLSWSSPGPRGITVEVRRGENTVTAQRTTFVWWPAETTTATRLSLLAPITATRGSTDAGAATPEVVDDLSAGGRLSRVLQATRDTAFAWAVDPAVLASAAAMRGDGATSSPSAGPGGATPSTSASGTATGGDPTVVAGTAWLKAFSQQLPGRTVIGLPYGDPDLSSVLNNKAAPLLRMTGDLGRRMTRETVGQSFDTSIAWPGDGRLATRSVSALARSGHTGVLLASATQPVEDAADGRTYTGRSTVTGGGRSVKGLLYDERLSTLVSAGGGADSVLSRQTLLAQLATLTNSSPDQPLHLLAATPRSWSPDPAKVAALVQTLRDAPYVQLATVPELVSQDPVEQRAQPVYGAGAKAAELPPSAVQRASALTRRIDVLAASVSEPETMLDPYRKRVSSLLSVAWRGDRDQLATAGTDVDRAVAGLVDGVHLQVGNKSKLFTAKESSIPLAVSNSTPFDMRVTVVLRPGSGQIVMKSQQVVAKADSRTNVLVPAEAIASGDVTVTATLQNPGKGVIEEPQQFLVRVRPDWEAWGMAGAGSVLGLLLVVGLLRGVRRTRNRVPPAAVPDVDDLAVQLEEERRGPPTGSVPVRPEGTVAQVEVEAQVEVGAKAGDDR